MPVSRTIKKKRTSVVSNGNRTRRMYVCILDVSFAFAVKKMIFNNLFYLFIAYLECITWIVILIKARRGHLVAYHRGIGDRELLDKCLVKTRLYIFFFKKRLHPEWQRVVQRVIKFSPVLVWGLSESEKIFRTWHTVLANLLWGESE